MTKEMGPDRRFPQADREAWITLALYGLYFVWWYVCAYGLGGGDPEGYSYVFGFPAWFFLWLRPRLSGAYPAPVARGPLLFQGLEPGSGRGNAALFP